MKKIILTIIAFLVPMSSFAYFFNASYFQLDATTPDEPTSQITMMAWVYSTSTATQFIVHRGSVQEQYMCRLQSGTSVRMSINATGTPFVMTSSASAPVNKWNHIACVYDGTKQVIYINSASTTSRSMTGNLIATTTYMRVGSGRTATNGSSLTMGGWIQDLRIYNRALSAKEIQNYYLTSTANNTGLVYHFPLLWTTAMNIGSSRNNNASTTNSTPFMSKRGALIGRYRR